MGRIPSQASLTRRAAKLKARDAALKTRQAAAPKVGTGQARPSQTVKYVSLFTGESFLVQAPNAGVKFFGGIAELGLAAADASPRLPRGFRTAKMKAVKGKAKPTEVTSKLSEQPYLKYSIEATGDTQSSFSAPVSAATSAAIKTKVQTIFTAVKAEVGGYGRIWFEPERPLFSETGGGNGAAGGGAAGGG